MATSIDRRTFVAGTLGATVAGGFATRAATSATASETDWRISESPIGTSFLFAHRGSQWHWKNPGGDWRDADGVAQGGRAFAVFASPNTGETAQTWTFDVTALVRKVTGESSAPLELLLRATAPRNVASRESTEDLRPVIEVVTAGGRTTHLTCLSDVALDGSTFQVLGDGASLGIDEGRSAALRFERPDEDVTKATLRLVSTRQYAGTSQIQVFRLTLPDRPRVREQGLAARYDHDAGLAEDPDVLYVLDADRRLEDSFFKADPPWDDWMHFDWSGRDDSLYPMAIGNRFAISVNQPWPTAVDGGFTDFGYRPLSERSPRALMWSCAQDQELVTDANYFFRPTPTGDQREPFDPKGRLPQEMYMRWYVLLGNDLLLADGEKRHGGKWGPGFSHKSRIAGWGGRFANTPADIAGRAGWTSRGQFEVGVFPNDPAFGGLMTGSYQYNAEVSQVAWMFGPTGVLWPGRWYCCEIYQRMNGFDPSGTTPAARDGVVRAWVDGRLAFEKTDCQWRANPPWVEGSGVVADQGILGVWWNTFWGGQYGGAPKANHHFIKNLAIAQRYIGPMKMG